MRKKCKAHLGVNDAAGDNNKVVNVDAVVDALLALSWTDNEPFSKDVGITIGMFCAQIARDLKRDMSILFLDAGICTAALLTAVSFSSMYRYLQLSSNDDETRRICVCATTDPIYYPKTCNSGEYAEFACSDLTTYVYPRLELDS